VVHRGFPHAQRTQAPGQATTTAAAVATAFEEHCKEKVGMLGQTIRGLRRHRPQLDDDRLARENSQLCHGARSENGEGCAKCKRSE